MSITLSDVLIHLSKDEATLSLQQDDSCPHFMWIRLDTPMTTEFLFKWDLTKKTLSEQQKGVPENFNEYVQNNDSLKFL